MFSVHLSSAGRVFLIDPGARITTTLAPDLPVPRGQAIVEQEGSKKEALDRAVHPCPTGDGRTCAP